MKFTTFLATPINGVLPIEKLKSDLSYFKKTFNYATKTEELYNNLIDNIIFIIQSKYGRFDILYRETSVMYNELLLTISPQIPQFLMIQKKQLLESLDTFATLNNWGDVLIDDVKRQLNLSTSGENKQNYIPIDGTNKDPYSSNDINSNEDQNETTTVNRNATDYLEYYSRFRWNTASLEIEKILKEYIKLFKIYYVGTDTTDSTPLPPDLEQRVINLENNQTIIVNEIDDLQQELNRVDGDLTTLTSVVNNHTNEISTLTNNVEQLATNKADKTQLNNYYQKSETYSKTESDNRFGSLSVQNTNSTNIVNLNNTKADKTQLEEKLLASYATTIRTVRTAPQAQTGTGFWYCDFETNLTIGDNNFRNVDICGVSLVDSNNKWVVLKPLKWYFNGGRVGVVLYSTTQYDINGATQGAGVDIWVNHSYYYTAPTKINNSSYEG